MLSLTSRTAVVSLSSCGVREGTVLRDVDDPDSDEMVWDMLARPMVLDTVFGPDSGGS